MNVLLGVLIATVASGPADCVHLSCGLGLGEKEGSVIGVVLEGHAKSGRGPQVGSLPVIL